MSKKINQVYFIVVRARFIGPETMNYDRVGPKHLTKEAALKWLELVKAKLDEYTKIVRITEEEVL